jgi:hypothetical protein
LTPLVLLVLIGADYGEKVASWRFFSIVMLKGVALARISQTPTMKRPFAPV